MKPLLICAAALMYVVGWLAGIAADAAIWCWSGIAAGWDDARDLERRHTVARIERQRAADHAAERDLVRTG